MWNELEDANRPLISLIWLLFLICSIKNKNIYIYNLERKTVSEYLKRKSINPKCLLIRRIIYHLLSWSYPRVPKVYPWLCAWRLFPRLWRTIQSQGFTPGSWIQPLFNLLDYFLQFNNHSYCWNQCRWQPSIFILKITLQILVSMGLWDMKNL